MAYIRQRHEEARRRSEADQSVRVRVQNREKTITSTYTNDTSGMSSSRQESERAWKELGKRFKIKDLGNLKFVLGIRITRDHD